MNNKNINIRKISVAAIMSALIFPGGQAIADVLNSTLGEILYEEHFNTLAPSIWQTVVKVILAKFKPATNCIRVNFHLSA